MIDENIKRIIEFFKYLDPNFFKDFKELLDSIIKVSPTELNEEEIINKITENQGIDLNIIVNDCCEFFRSINPQYEEMARNLIRDPKQIKFRCPVNNLKGLNSHQTLVDLFQNWHDVCILSHELTHGFVMPANYMDREKQFNLITELFVEAPSIVVELLAKDFLLEKRGIEANGLEKLRTYNLKDVYDQLYDENGDVVAGFQGIIDYIQDNSKINQTLEDLINSHLSKDFEFTMVVFLMSYTYIIGILIASYIYQKIKEDPNNVYMLDNMLAILPKAFTYPEECIKLLEDMGIPIVCDGKISLNKDNMKVLYDSYFETFGDNYHSKTK